MKKLFFLVLTMIMLTPCLHAQNQTVTVILQHDAAFTDQNILSLMETNLSRVLSEIGNAYNADRQLFLGGLPMSDIAKNQLAKLWKESKFKCDDDYPMPRLWTMADKSYMVRQIPFVLTSRDNTVKDQYQEAVANFDKNGIITDFLFSSYSEVVGDGTAVKDISRRQIILQYCDRFRTAYNTKDMKFLQQVFSEKALIITGQVVTTKAYDGKPITSIKYKKQDKEQYLKNLQNVFNKNSWINVKFTQIGLSGEDNEELGIVQSSVNPNWYGVSLRQEWTSAGYKDVGYVFLLWDFTNEDAPVIHVRTWQPEFIGGGRKISEEELFTLSDFEEL